MSPSRWRRTRGTTAAEMREERTGGLRTKSRRLRGFHGASRVLQTRGIHPTAGKDTGHEQALPYAGIAASIVLIAFGIGAIYMGIDGRDHVRNDLAASRSSAPPDSTHPRPEGRHRQRGPGLRQGHAQAHPRGHRRPDLRPDGPLPRARRQGRPTTRSPPPIDPKTGKPVENGLRNMWVNETALSTALNTAYFAESVATFAIVMGIALLLAGLGFAVLTLRVLRVLGKEEDTEPAVARSGAVLAS